MLALGVVTVLCINDSTLGMLIKKFDCILVTSEMKVISKKMK